MAATDELAPSTRRAPRRAPWASIRWRATVLLVFVAVTPAALVAASLTHLYAAAILTGERTLQAAVSGEVVTATREETGAALADLEAVAAALAAAAAGPAAAEGTELITAVLGSRRRLDAVRFEVPAAKVSTLLRRAGSTTVVPEATAELRQRADEAGVAWGLLGDGAALVVTPVGSPKGGARGYAVATLRFDGLAARLATIAGTRFDDPRVELTVVSRERRLVVAHGVPGLMPGADATAYPALAAAAHLDWGRRVAVVADHAAGGEARVAITETIPSLGWAVTVSRPRAAAYRNLYSLTPRLLAAGLFAVGLAMLAGALAARAVTRPLLELAEQARRLGHRRFAAVSIDTVRSDELGELGRAMATMANDLAESEAATLREATLRASLSRFLSRPLVDAIVSGEHELELGGQRAEVTVLFADVVAFTPLVEARPAEEIVTLLNELFGVLSEVVFRHQGFVDKFIGDSIMGVWGAPRPQADHADRALAAAADMLRFLAVANEDWATRYGVEIRLGIGLNSGEAIVGNIGSQKRMEYTVVGDAVNVAARLEALARPGQILVGARTQALATASTRLRSLGPRALTGREAPVEVFELVP